MSNDAATIDELIEQIKNSPPFESLAATRKLVALTQESKKTGEADLARAAAAPPSLDEQVRAALAALKQPSIEKQLARAGASLRDPVLEAMRNLETALAAAGSTEDEPAATESPR